MIPDHVREGVLTEATNDYAGPILPGFRETAWIQKSPYFHRAAKHGVRAYDLYNHMLMPGLYTDPVEEYWHLVNNVTPPPPPPQPHPPHPPPPRLPPTPTPPPPHPAHPPPTPTPHPPP